MTQSVDEKKLGKRLRRETGRASRVGTSFQVFVLDEHTPLQKSSPIGKVTRSHLITHRYLDPPLLIINY